MPIRFQCPDCLSKLKIGSHKAGSQKECPFCHIMLRIPEGRGDSVVMATRVESAGASEDSTSDEAPTSAGPAVSGDEPAESSDADKSAGDSGVVKTSRRRRPVEPPPLSGSDEAPSSEAAVRVPVEREPAVGGLEIGSGESGAATTGLPSGFVSVETSVEGAERELGRAQRTDAIGSAIQARVEGRQAAATIEFPRRTVYVLGGLLLVVAVFFFVFGFMTGRASQRRTSRQAGPISTEAVVTGGVYYRVNNQREPDAGSVVIFVPAETRPDVRPDPAGLHPLTGAGATGVDAQLIRSWGGEVVRVGESGEFRVELRSGRRYGVLVISGNASREEGISRELRAAWGPIFVPIEPLVGSQAYKMLEVEVQGARFELPPVDLG